MAKKFTARRNTSYLGAIQRCLDVFIVGMSFMATHDFYSAVSVIHGYAALVSALGFLLIANAFGVYKSFDHNLKGTGFGTLATTWLATLAMMLLFAYATKTSAMFSRVAVAGWMVLVPVLLVLTRIFLRFILFSLSRVANSRMAAIAGHGESARRLINNLASRPDLGIKVAGIYSTKNRNEIRLNDQQSLMWRGMLAELVDEVRRGTYDEVYIALDMDEEKQIADLISDLSDCAVPVYFVPSLFAMNLMISQVYYLDSMPVVSVYDTPMDDFDIFLKRAEDIILSSLILFVIAIPMLIISISIKITSKGPVIFKQRRYGLGGTSIEVWKFRSMTACDNGDVVVQAKKTDKRITPLGAFLRKTSLDELPQFLNVLQGSMSIVGPRPHAIAHNELYRKDIQGYMLRHLVKPGITGWAQINGWRGETDTIEKMEMRVKYDLEYIRRWSLWFDLKIILLTILKGFVHENAY